MLRWLWIVIGALVALAGIVFSAINVEPARLDFYFGSVTMPLGILVLLTLFGGFLLAGLVLWGGVIVPLRLRLGSLRRQAQRATAPREPAPDAVAGKRD